jgi:hypothetical protein
LVDPNLWPLIPTDVPELLALLPHADLYVQDEVGIRHVPTLTRVWSRRGHLGHRQVRAPGRNQKSVGFAAMDWRDVRALIGVTRYAVLHASESLTRNMPFSVCLVCCGSLIMVDD